jgi:DNA-binding CsgD family transcriptional regulator
MATRQEDSPTRKAVKAMTAQGYSVREIAEALHISYQAVRKHLAKIATEIAGEPEEASA